MYPLPPWLVATPADYLRASEAGASLGLSTGEARVRQQEIQNRQALAAQELGQRQIESAGHLGLGYAGLEAQERHQQIALQAAKERAAAALVQRQQSMDFLNRYRQENMQRQRAQAAAADQLRLATLSKPTLHFGAGGEIVQYNPASGELTQVRPPQGKTSSKKTQAQVTEEYDLKQRIASTDKAMAAILKQGPIDMEKVKAGDKQEIKRQTALAEVTTQRNELMDSLSRVGESPFKPVMGARAMLDEASMGDQSQGTTSTGLRYSIVPAK